MDDSVGDDEEFKSSSSAMGDISRLTVGIGTRNTRPNSNKSDIVKFWDNFFIDGKSGLTEDLAFKYNKVLVYMNYKKTFSNENRGG